MSKLQDRLREVFPPPMERGVMANIAKICEVSRPTVSAWFNNPEKVSTISRRHAELICAAYDLKVSPAWLAEGLGQREIGVHQDRHFDGIFSPVTERIYQAIAHITGKPSVGPTEVSKFLGLANSQTAKNWESRGPSSDGLVAAAERGINMRWMKYGEGAMNDGVPAGHAPAARPPSLVPLISSVQAGNWSEIVDSFQPGDAEDWLPCPVRHGPDTFCLTVDGESMSNPGGKPSYEPGDVIFVDPGRAAQPGDRVVVRLERQKQATFKQYLEEDGRKFLRALNPDWTPRLTPIDGEATICGVVIGKWVPEVE